MYTEEGRRGRSYGKLRLGEADLVREFSRKRRRYRVSEAIESKDILNKYLFFSAREALFGLVVRRTRNAAVKALVKRRTRNRKRARGSAYRRIFIISMEATTASDTFEVGSMKKKEEKRKRARKKVEETRE